MQSASGPRPARDQHAAMAPHNDCVFAATRNNKNCAALDRRVKSLYSPHPSYFRRLVATEASFSRTHRENGSAAIDEFDPHRGPSYACLRGRHGGRQPDRDRIRARELRDEAVHAWLSRSPQASGTARRVSASCPLLTREARIPDGSGPFCLSFALWGKRPSRRDAAGAATFLNKMPRGSTGTGRARASHSCGCSSVGRARPRHG